MNSAQFDAILKSRLEKIRAVLSSKAEEYAQGGKDRLYNFKRAAQIERVTPQRALWGMFAKHLVSVIDMVEGTLPATSAMVNEKIGDAINYLILLEAVFKEQECVDCGECSNGVRVTVEGTDEPGMVRDRSHKIGESGDA